MTKSIKLKLGLIMGSFLVIIIATIAATFWTAGQLKSDGTVINTAGRQRMLTQKLTKEVTALLQGKAKKADVLATADLFDKSLTALISGDAAQGIPPTKDAVVLAQLEKVRGMWVEFRANIDGLISVSDEKSSVYGYLMSRNVPLLQEMNVVVTTMEEHGLDPKTINLAGRQRMLTQKLTKEALILSLGTATADEFATMVGTIGLFGRTLNGLMNGDSELGLKPVKNLAVISKLQKVKEEWDPFNINALKLVNLTEMSRKFSSNVFANNVPLLKEMNAAVGLYEAISAGKIASLKKMQMVFLLATVAVFVTGWILLSRIIVNPVKKIAELAKRIAGGDLMGEAIKIDSKDELGELGRTVDEMKGNLNGMISGIRNASMQVSTASGQLADGNTAFSQRITEQSSSVEETASTMEEIAAGVRQNADTCREASKLAADCRNKAEEGGSVMDKMMSSVQEINQSGKKISDIINVIEEISFQTNLLALNAAVEAARAGEQGKGFAVVAVEVRNLAHRSSQAAKEITALIKENVEKAGAGVEFAEMTRANQEEIIISVKKVTDLITEINAASQEQSSGVEQVNKAISQLDQVTQQNAALLEESSATSEEMSAQASHLLELVGGFKVSTEPAHGTSVVKLPITGPQRALSEKTTVGKKSKCPIKSVLSRGPGEAVDEGLDRVVDL